MTATLEQWPQRMTSDRKFSAQTNDLVGIQAEVLPLVGHTDLRFDLPSHRKNHDFLGQDELGRQRALGLVKNAGQRIRLMFLELDGKK